MKITALLSITTIVASILPSQISARMINAYVEFPTNAITTTVPVDGTQIELGDTQKNVEKNLGAPTTRLSSNEWLYENLVITLANGRQLQSKSILLVFIDGKLSSAAAVGDKKRDRLIAESRSRTAKQVVVTTGE